MKVPAVPVEHWTTDDVARWLVQEGFEAYANLFTNEHRINGRILLVLTELDLRQPPLQLKVLGDIKLLSQAINELRNSASGSVAPSGPRDRPPSLEVNGDQHLNQVPGGVVSLHSASDDGRGPIGFNQNVSLGHTCHSRFHHDHDGDGPNFSSIVGSQQRTKMLDHELCVSNSVSKESLALPNSFLPEISLNGGDLLISRVESPDTYSKSVAKTILAGVYFAISILITSYIMVEVHDRVPDMKKYPPLPDIFLDNLPLIPWAFQLCELLACFMGFLWTVVLFFHKQRLILLRRMFSLTGTVFLLRCVTMIITSMSVPGVHLECSGRAYGDFRAKMRQAFQIWFGMGLSVRGVRTCGDYMFSGHTVALTMLNHFITEYTPDTWVMLHTFVWVMNLFGTFFILAGHEHYSIDVFVAFFISSRLFLYYHSMAYSAPHLSTMDARTRIWFPLFWFFESGGQVGRVPNEYEWPLPSVSSLWTGLCDVISGKFLPNSMPVMDRLWWLRTSQREKILHARPSLADTRTVPAQMNGTSAPATAHQSQKATEDCKTSSANLSEHHTAPHKRKSKKSPAAK